ncbi:nucleoside diphosphate-linked moiety X motif 8 isoform X2 [Silurus meridionalis]|uniref:nucleoside diphosphate-linked moiety X motif 8 isoform X2 n=1 Tax=Silurus meridionalis TaxID=175797 RepID=UPI001EE9CE33|nr:nucleoside diphosphate-linked moiety X motif 8 isoform X2 [Silurus meridionalis]
MRMFRSAKYLVSACVRGNHRSLFGTFSKSMKNVGERLCNGFLSKPICIVNSVKGAQMKHLHISEPKNSKYVSEKALRKPSSWLVSISADNTTNFLSVCKINVSIPNCYSTTISDHFILWDCVPNKSLLPENHTSNHQCPRYKWRTNLNSNRKSQKIYHKTRNASFTKSYEIIKGPGTFYQERWHDIGPLKSQVCGLHRRVPQQAAFEDCLSAKNEERCRVHLQSNIALYEKQRGKRWAAVLVSLCTVGEEPALLFTLRSSKLRGKHKGDVSFAGGKQDPSDKNIVETALREAREELGINVTENEVWGLLKPLNDVSGMMIAPVLANLGPLETLTLRPNPCEVEEIFTVTVAHLCKPQNRGYTHFRAGNRYGYTLPVFHSEKYRIWGLTAIALDQTLKLIMPV